MVIRDWISTTFYGVYVTGDINRFFILIKKHNYHYFLRKLKSKKLKQQKTLH